MKKFVLTLFLIFFLFSCTNKDGVNLILNSLEPQIALAEVQDIENLSSGDSKDNDGINYHIDYPIFENKDLTNSINLYFDNLIKQKKNNIKNSDYKNYIPEIHASFHEYSGLGIKSIVYEIFESLPSGKEIEYIKVFYISNKGNELMPNDIFVLNSGNVKKLKSILYYKLIGLDGLNINKDNLNIALDQYINQMTFYIENNNVYFLFDYKVIGSHFNGIFSLKINFTDLKDLINNSNIINNSEKVYDNKESKNLKDDKLLINSNEQKSDIKLTNLSKDKKYIALTFDDGPSKSNTLALLKILDKHEVKATFFVLGKNVTYFPEIIKQIDKGGHELGNHSWNHPQLTRLAESEIKKQLKDTDNEIFSIIGKTPKLLRPPYGEFNQEVIKIADRTLIMWDVDSLDWKTRNVELNVSNVKKDTKEGSIILMHDIHKTSVDSIDEIILNLLEEGFEFLTVSELLGHYQKNDYYGKVCYSGFICK